VGAALLFYLTPAINNATDHWLPKRNEHSAILLELMSVWLPRSSVHHHNQVSDWTSVLLAFPLLHCSILPSNRVDCVVPKNHAGLSTHAAPGSPLTFLEKSPTDLIEITIKGEFVAPHHQKERIDGHLYQAGIYTHSSFAVTIYPMAYSLRSYYST
jgi:hypothetical protein